MTYKTGRRARNRAARHDQVMAAATEIISAEGHEGLTMMAVADIVGCAVGTIYTYFDSKSALIAALQTTAIQKLMGTYHQASDLWEDHLDELELDDAVLALARLVAMSRLFVALQDLNPREFEMLQMLITVKQDLTTNEDREAVLPVAFAFINDIRALIENAAETGALDAASEIPYAGRDSAPDNPFDRTLRWIGSINGVLLVSNVGVDPNRVAPGLFDGRRFAADLSHDFLIAWGAPREVLREAYEIVDGMEDAGQLLPVVTSLVDFSADAPLADEAASAGDAERADKAERPDDAQRL